MTNPYDQQANPYSGQPDATKETDAQTQNSQQNAGNPQGGDALPQETQSNVMKSQAYVVSCLACGQEGTRANVPQTLACRCGSRNLVYEAAEDLDAVKLYFGYSDTKAVQALRILTEKQLETIRKVTTIGE